MGTRVFTKRVTGMTMDEAFQEAQEEAKREYGDDIYNGHINNCTLHGDVTRKYNAATDKRKFIDDLHDEMGKGEAYGVLLKEPKPNKNKVKSVVEVIPQKGARKWVTKFVIDKSFNPNGPTHSVYADSQTEAIKRARMLAEKNKESYDIYIQKQLHKGIARVATVKYKRSTEEKEGEYLFICAAAE